VIGAGPAGLSAAWFLSMLGYACHVFEASAEAGGVLRWGIPLYRLPLNALRHDIQQIEARGVTIYTGKPVSPDALEKMKKDYDAVFIGCGHGRGMSMKVPGEDLKEVSEGLDFLRKLREGETPPCRGVSAIIGGGNTAIDVAAASCVWAEKRCCSIGGAVRICPLWNWKWKWHWKKAWNFRNSLLRLPLPGKRIRSS